MDDLSKLPQHTNSLPKETDNIVESYKNINTTNKRIFEFISDFASQHKVEIEFEFNRFGELIITMTRDEYRIRRVCMEYELHWLEDCDDAVLNQLYIMLYEINKNYDKPL